MTNKIVDELIALGASSDTLMAVMRLIADAELTEARRTRNRARMRSVRTRAPTRKHTETPPQAYTTPQEVEKTKKSSLLRKHQIPPDFVPDPKVATDHGWPTDRARSEAERFLDHAKATGRKLADWPAGWRNWVNSPYQNHARQENGHAPRPGSREDRAERTANAMEKLRNFANGHHPDEPGAGGPAREPPFGGLPFPKPA